MMGVYERSAHRKANGAPVFVKQVDGGGEHFLYRTSKGKWYVATAEASIAKGAGVICSSRAADLPYESGLGWSVMAGKGGEDGEPFWITDPNALVGKRVTVLWSKGKRYKGACKHYDPKDGRHFIVYDDGEKKWYTMSQKTFWVNDGTVESEDIKYAPKAATATATGAAASAAAGRTNSNTGGGGTVWHDDPGLGCFARLL